MKKLILAAAFGMFGLATAQTDAFIGEGDVKAQVGANFQDGGTGIQASLDYGLGDSFSIGAQAGYLLGVKEIDGLGTPEAGDRFDAKVRANAHLGDVIGLPHNFDIYPGLDLGLKNFGGHVGTRVFFDKGFGLFAEAQFPIARFNKDAVGYELLNNQFNIAVGASFDITKR